MSKVNFAIRATGAAALAAITFAAGLSSAEAAASDYRFELAGKPTVKAGVNRVEVRLIHLPDRKQVTGAIIIQTRADMGPEQMAAMTAPVKAAPAGQPGVYAFEIQNGPIWNKPGKWALSLAAKVQGEADTVRGTITLDLNP